jgi:hypothetical protein
MSIVTLLTDFGTDSPYVAAMKGVILAINPALTIVDLTHAIPPQDVRLGAFVLSQVCPRFPEGTIHVAVVDPGVGSQRAIVYVESDGQRYIGPDNGLLSRVARPTGAARIVALENRDLWLPRVSTTFHGRDIMAPVAARLTLGLDVNRLGPTRASLVELDWPQPRVEARRIVGEIQAVDSFGNLISNVEPGHLQAIPPGATPIVRIGGESINGIASAYAQRPVGSLAALIGSGGFLEIALVNGNAAKQLQLGVGATIHVQW